MPVPVLVLYQRANTNTWNADIEHMALSGATSNESGGERLPGEVHEQGPSPSASLSSRLTGQHAPDILDTLANLSSDEVFTPPSIARQMLSELPDALWKDPNTRILDVACKSGVFLREAAVLLDKGLADVLPDAQQRREHIFQNMLFGLPITTLTGDVSRRTLYYAKDATSPGSVVQMSHPQGNLPFVRMEHVFKKSKTSCDVCGARAGLERGIDKENHAYAFIHPIKDKRLKEILAMEFDLIIGNPPYQLNDGGGGRGSSATPLYHLFVEQAIRMNPRFISMITPSRWFSGGKGLDSFREAMLKDKHISHVVDFPDASECFPGVEIKGGVSYFVWDRNHRFDTAVVTTIMNGEVLSKDRRDMDEHDVFIRFSQAVPILQKVKSRNETTMDSQVSARKPFGFPSNYSEILTDDPGNGVRIYANGKTGWVARSSIQKNADWVKRHKVLTAKAATGEGKFPTSVTSSPFYAAPNTCCTETYLVCGMYGTKQEADNLVAYMKTRFFRFLVWLRKPTQNMAQGTFAFVPRLDMKTTWTDQALYRRYGLTDEEVGFIDSIVKEMP